MGYHHPQPRVEHTPGHGTPHDNHDNHDNLP